MERKKIEMASSLEADREDKASRLFERLVKQTGKTRKSYVVKCKVQGKDKNMAML